jgi:hypothetical protein
MKCNSYDCEKKTRCPLQIFLEEQNTISRSGWLFVVLCHHNRINDLNRIQAIRDSEVRATVFFTRKIHALNTLKMRPLLRSNVMQS